MTNFRAVLFDWRGTLALTCLDRIQLALEGLNLPALLPALRSVTDCRLHLVTALLE
jgi:hypothetical protein